MSAKDFLGYSSDGTVHDFGRTLPDDTVEYSIQVVNSDIDEAAAKSRLEEVQAGAQKLIEQHLSGYIWEREPFKLEVVSSDDAKGKQPIKSTWWSLRGSTNFGDSVEDEWVIVWLLHTLSQQFTDVWMRIVDTDGQFLLSEAANVLPLWMGPENADHRIFLHDGKLVIIPLDSRNYAEMLDIDDDNNLTLEEAFKFLADPTKKVQCSRKIQAAAFKRIQKYPEQVEESMHRSIVTLPRNLAYILHVAPSLISTAVEKVYLRDPVFLRAILNKEPDGLVFGPKDCVQTSVKFTKVGFAQLKHQHFRVPEVWAQYLHSLHDAKAQSQCEIGMKVACGFEMLLSDMEAKGEPLVMRIIRMLGDVASGKTKLPSDEEMKSWSGADDDEKWLDIDYAEFEKELAGGQDNDSDFGGGWIDKRAQANLREIVQQFKGLNGKGADGDDLAGFFSDSEDDENDSDEDEDAAEQADRKEWLESQKEFSAMMREIMEMPESVMDEIMSMPVDQLESKRSEILAGKGKLVPSKSADAGDASDSDSDGQTEAQYAQAMAQTASELRDAGILPSDEEDESGSK